MLPVRQKGLEPSTSPLSGACSSQLSYWRARGRQYSETHPHPAGTGCFSRQRPQRSALYRERPSLSTISVDPVLWTGVLGNQPHSGRSSGPKNSNSWLLMTA